MVWFISQTVNAVLQLVIALVIFITNKLIQPLGFNPAVIRTYFPGIDVVSDAFKILGIFILIIIVLFQLTRNIFGSLSYGEKDHSISLIFRGTIAVALILFSMTIMSYLFHVFSQPFYVLNDNSGSFKVFNVVEDEEGIFRDSITEAFDRFLKSAENINESEYDSTIDKIQNWLFPGKTILNGLIQLICIALIGYKLILFLLEILERYLLLMLQAYTSPLIWSTLPSKATVGIFVKWLEMFISNFILVYLNMWMLGLIINAMGKVFHPEPDQIFGNFKPNFILGVCLIYAMLRIAQAADHYLNRLICTASSGVGLGQEIFMTLHTLQNSFHKTSRAIGGSVSGFYGGDNESIHSGSPEPDDPVSGGSGQTETIQYNDAKYESEKDRFRNLEKGKKPFSNETQVHSLDGSVKQNEDLSLGSFRERDEAGARYSVSDAFHANLENIDQEDSSSETLRDIYREDSLLGYFESDLSGQDQRSLDSFLDSTGIESRVFYDTVLSSTGSIPLQIESVGEDKIAVFGRSGIDGVNQCIGYLCPVSESGNLTKTIPGAEQSYQFIPEDGLAVIDQEDEVIIPDEIETIEPEVVYPESLQIENQPEITYPKLKEVVERMRSNKPADLSQINSRLFAKREQLKLTQESLNSKAITLTDREKEAITLKELFNSDSELIEAEVLETEFYD